MVYRIVGDATMLVHFGFLVFVTLGGFLAWRWRRLIGVHLVVSAWAFVIVVLGPPCPLTGIENWARTQAGETPLHGTGFIDNYLEGVVYPARYTGLLQALVALAVVVSWVGYVVRGRRARGRGVRGRGVRAGRVRAGDLAGEATKRHT
ncbi:MAG TPA: DUF2784 domain-containing protein [Dermatophilaceae bacterium]|nr:DUF2784 domain-containing protein [Dermatophilaceae bacterium]